MAASKRAQIIPVYTRVLRRRQSWCVIAGTVDRIAGCGARSKTLLSQSRFSSPSSPFLLLVPPSVLQLPRLPPLPTSFHNVYASPPSLGKGEQVLVEEGGGTRSESKIEADDRIPKDRRHLTRMATVD